jgi:hypothetical protein
LDSSFKIKDLGFSQSSAVYNAINFIPEIRKEVSTAGQTSNSHRGIYLDQPFSGSFLCFRLAASNTAIVDNGDNLIE